MFFEKHKRMFYWIIYSLLFCIISFYGIFIVFYENGDSFIASYDSLDQHYIGFIYVGRWIRNLFKGIFIDHSNAFQMWDISIGYGSDVLSTLAVYFGDPFYWFSALVPESASEVAFGAIIFIKIYLCGITYSLLSFEKKNPEMATLCGALVYALAGSVYIGFLQTIFLSVMYLFPLVILGVERLRVKRKWGVYVFALSMVFITYFYFAYMVSVLVFLYCVISFCFDNTENRTIKNLKRQITDFVLFSILSAGVAAFIVIPTAMGMMGADRLSISYYVPLLYPLDRYMDFVSRFFDWQWGGMDCYFGVSAIAAPCLIALFYKRHKFVKIKLIFLLLTVGFLFPYFGYILNGFGYVTNRWSWAYSLCVAYIVTLMVAELKVIFVDRKYLPILVAIIYILIVELVMHRNDIETNIVMACVMICCIFAAIASYIPKTYYYMITVLLVSVSIVLNSRFYFMSSYSAYKEEISQKYGFAIIDYMDEGTALNKIKNSAALPILENNGTKINTRYDSRGVDTVRNASYYHRISGMDFYCSLYNSDIDRFHNSVALLTSPWVNGYNGLDSRTELEMLFGVSHYIVPDWGQKWVPYGFDYVEAEAVIDESRYLSFCSGDKNGLAYLFHKNVNNSIYDSFNPIERQQLITKAIVAENGDDDWIGIDIDSQELSYIVSYIDGIEVIENGFEVLRDGAHIILDFDEKIDSEIYVYFDNITYKNGTDFDYVIFADGMDGDNYVYGMNSGYYGLNNRSHIFGGKNNWLLNLGHSNEKINRVKITFGKKGKYFIDGIHLYSRNKESVLNNVNALNSVGNNIDISCNRINLSINADAEGYVLLTVPYSKGWTTYVDGVRTRNEKADKAFIGIPVSMGEHDISLLYHTPGLYIGLLVTFLSLLALVTARYKWGTEN